MALSRKKTLNVFNEARRTWGSYDDFPIGPVGTDPMPHLSRNRVAQPFFLVCAEDQVLVQMAGGGEIQFKEIEPSRMTLEPGDTVYIPAGVPSRLVPDGENLQVRLEAEPRGRRAVAWYCDECGELVASQELDDGIPQAQYWDAVQAYNADVARRTCGDCGHVHGPVELGDIAWPEVAAALEGP